VRFNDSNEITTPFARCLNPDEITMKLRIDGAKRPDNREDKGGRDVFEAISRQIASLDWTAQVDLAKTLDGSRGWDELEEDQKRIFRRIHAELK